MKEENFEFTQYMEAPCQCDCGEWFDLDEGLGSKKSSIVVCRKCGKKEEEEIEIQESEVRALSWKQPYAELMLHGKIETRTWSTSYRGLVLICASKIGYNEKQVINISGEAQFKRIYDQLGIIDPFLYFKRRNWGEAIAIGELVDCRAMQPGDEDKCFVKYHPELFCHVYKNVRAIDPFRWKGTQGWKVLDWEMKQEIKLL